MKKKIHSVSCLTRVYLCAEIETIWIFDPCHKNLIFVRFLHGCPLNKDHLWYTSLANSSHGGSSIRPSKILLRHNTYVRTNDYINQIYLNAHIIPWSCLSKHSPYGFKLFTESLFSMRCLRYNPHERIKSSSYKFCRAVSIIVNNWKTICINKHRVTTKCQRNQYFSRLIVTEEFLGEMSALKNKFLAQNWRRNDWYSQCWMRCSNLLSELHSIMDIKEQCAKYQTKQKNTSRLYRVQCPLVKLYLTVSRKNIRFYYWLIGFILSLEFSRCTV